MILFDLKRHIGLHFFKLQQAISLCYARTHHFSDIPVASILINKLGSRSSSKLDSGT